MGKYAKSTSLANVNALFDFIHTTLTVGSPTWTVDKIMNGLTTQPLPDCIGRETIYRPPGFAAGAGNAGFAFDSVTGRGGGVGIYRGYGQRTVPMANFLGTYSFSGRSDYYDLVSASVAAATRTCTATTTGVNTLLDDTGSGGNGGDLVAINGTDIPEVNAGFDAWGGPTRISGRVGNQFVTTIGRNNAPGGGWNSTGGTAVALYNMMGARAASFEFIEPTMSLGTDGTLDAFMFVDEFAFMLCVQKGGLYYFLSEGIGGFSHIQADGSRRALCLNDTVGAGVGNPTVVPLDRTPANFFIEDVVKNTHMRCTIYQPDSSGFQYDGTKAAGGAGQSHNGSGYFKVVAKITGPDSVSLFDVPNTVTIRKGALICDDGANYFAMGSGSQGNGNGNFNSRLFYSPRIPDILTQNTNLEKELNLPVWGADAQTPVGVGIGELDPTRAGRYQEVATRLSPNVIASDGFRYPVRGVRCFFKGPINDQDILQTGSPAAAPAGDYLMLVNVPYSIGGACVALGDQVLP